MKQLEFEVAKLQQKLSKFPCYSKVPKPTNLPDFNATKIVIYKAKLKAFKSVDKKLGVSDKQ